MASQRSALPRATPLLMVLVAYAAVAAWLIPQTRWQMNPDGVSYILISRRLLAGDFHGALSAHWSPLFSWMLLPILWCGVEPLFACKLLTYSIGAATLIAFWSVSAVFTSNTARRTIITAAFAAAVLAWASSLITPDLMLVCPLLLYLLFTFKAAKAPRVRTAIVAGLLGGLGYLTKAYAFPFVVAHFTIVHVALWAAPRLSEQRRAITRQFLAGIFAFLAITLPWIVALSIKYGHVTLGSAGPYSWHVVGPLARGHPVETEGLLEPSDADALSVWDDPSRLRFPPWPMKVSSVGYLARLMRDNFFRLLGIIESWSLVAVPLLGVALWRVVRRKGSATRRTIVGWTLATGALYGAGFMPLLLEARYLWILYGLILLVTIAVFDDLAEFGARPRRGGRLLFAIVVLSFAIRPMLSRPFDEDQGLIARQQADDLIRQGVNISNHRLASDRDWESTLYLNYFLGAHYYGTPRREQKAVEISRELDRYGIDAFLVWGGLEPPYLGAFQRVGVSPHAFVLYGRARVLPYSNLHHVKQRER